MSVTREEPRVPELDGLRGVAIALVLALHIVIRPNHAMWQNLLGDSVYRLMDMAWCGVDIFFVLSGFLIGGIIFDQRYSKNFYRAFYARRTTRIFPAYFLLVALAFIPLGPVGIHAHSGNVPFAAYATFTANVLTSLGFYSSYWLGPLWSICIEEQFYLLAPFLLRLLPQKATPWALGIVILSSASVRTAWSFGLVDHAFSVWDFTLVRLDGLTLGVLAAWLVRRDDFSSWAAERGTTLKWVFMFLLFLCVWLSQQSQEALLGPGIFLLSLTAFVSIVWLRTDRHSVLAQAMRLPRLALLGQRSYFLYLFHMPVFWFAQKLFLRNDLTAPFVPLMSLIFVGWLAALSWRYLEAPLLKLGRRIRYQPRGSRDQRSSLPPYPVTSR